MTWPTRRHGSISYSHHGEECRRAVRALHRGGPRLGSGQGAEMLSDRADLPEELRLLGRELFVAENACVTELRKLSQLVCDAG